MSPSDDPPPDGEASPNGEASSEGDAPHSDGDPPQSDGEASPDENESPVDDASPIDDASPVDDAPRSDEEKCEFMRAIADELRGESTESKQVAALLYRVSDVYDPEEDTDPRDVYVNMRTILRVKEAGGRPDPEGT